MGIVDEILQIIDEDIQNIKLCQSKISPHTLPYCEHQAAIKVLEKLKYRILEIIGN